MKNKYSSQNKNSSKIEFMPVIMASYIIIMMSGMLLIYDDFYYNILETKYKYYTTCTAVMIGVTCIYLFFMSHPLQAIKDNKGKKLLEIVSPADIAVLFWGIIIILSTLFSPVKKYAFSGSAGRYTGCLLLLTYIAAYFCITRFYKAKEWHMAIFLAAAMLMCLFGITDFFDMDLLKFKEEIKEIQRYMFTSTIGNINTYTSCVAMVMAFAGVMFAASDNVKRAAGYGICTFISFVALIVGESDNAYLSLAAFFGLLPLYLFRNRTGIKRYFVLIAGFFTAAKWVAVIQEAMPEQVIPIDGLFQIIADYKYLTQIVICLWCITIVCYVIDYVMSKSGRTRTVSPWLARGWLMIVILAIIMAVYIFYDVNIKGNAEKYGSLQTYLLFNDDWGTHRGYIWRIGVEDYNKFPPLQKLFGYGPDTFGIVTKLNNYPEMVERYYENFDSAHNEYLQYLVTIGPLGLLAYLAIHVSAVWQVVKEKLSHPICVASLFAVLCYAFQAAVNINQPIATPVMWTFLAISLSRTEKAGR